eukprot:CAMPEP_0176003292 /NCGR_PEP_ID=MMETSP0120_2-20121206/1098_1 /TAXON_ID=160619 /ORGANISM="Kryptoperidinium foliaceum, Strain CCMP 1326" /LENGTH=559 /DNA_ID=CAMNT_0017335929 /DNA_START=308 /DNA_END=1987 /DNA_ORIENTATION=-
MEVDGSSDKTKPHGGSGETTDDSSTSGKPRSEGSHYEESELLNLITTAANEKGGMVAAAASSNENDFDRAVADQLNRMSLDERERTLEEMHGVAPIHDETEELIAVKLKELQENIDRAPASERMMYDKALIQRGGSDYLKSRRYMLPFLRAENFDIEKAASRLLLNCTIKAKYYGEETAGRPLCLDDLSSEDIRALRSGVFGIFPRRDRSGRLVLFNHIVCTSVDCPLVLHFFKAYWYIAMSIVEDDEETQKRGAVSLLWFYHGQIRYYKDYDELAPDMNKPWLPLSPLKAVHVCVNPESTLKRLTARYSIAVSPEDMRYNMRLHVGSFTEIQYALTTFGIPMDDIPITQSGVAKAKVFHRWIEKRRYKERILMEKEREAGAPVHFLDLDTMIDVPTNQDVLLGVGKPISNHLGNKAFRSLVEMLTPRWENSTAIADKVQLSWEVVRHIQKIGGRFLKRNPKSDWWEVVSDKEAREKTGKLFTQSRTGPRTNGQKRGFSAVKESSTMLNVEDLVALEWQRLEELSEGKRRRVNDQSRAPSTETSKSCVPCFNLPPTTSM